MAGRRLSEIHAMIEARLETVRLVRMESERLRVLAEQMDENLVEEVVAEVGEVRAPGILAVARENDAETADRVAGPEAAEFMATYFWTALDEMGFAPPQAPAVEEPRPIVQVAAPPSVPALPHVPTGAASAPPVAETAPPVELASVPHSDGDRDEDALDPVVAAIVAEFDLKAKLEEIPEIVLVARRAAEDFDLEDKSYDRCKGKSAWKKRLYRELLKHYIRERPPAKAVDAPEPDVPPEDVVPADPPSEDARRGADVVAFSQRSFDPPRIVPTPVAARPSAESVPTEDRREAESGKASVAARDVGDDPPGLLSVAEDGMPAAPERMDVPVPGKVRDLRPKTFQPKPGPTVIPAQAGGKRAGLGFDISHRPKALAFRTEEDDEDRDADGRDPA